MRLLQHAQWKVSKIGYNKTVNCLQLWKDIYRRTIPKNCLGIITKDQYSTRIKSILQLLLWLPFYVPSSSLIGWENTQTWENQIETSMSISFLAVWTSGKSVPDMSYQSQSSRSCNQLNTSTKTNPRDNPKILPLKHLNWNLQRGMSDIEQLSLFHFIWELKLQPKS